ncbi:5622_t:CDS:2, partial [Cetraspora pellucida]
MSSPSALSYEVREPTDASSYDETQEVTNILPYNKAQELTEIYEVQEQPTAMAIQMNLKTMSHYLLLVVSLQVLQDIDYLKNLIVNGPILTMPLIKIMATQSNKVSCFRVASDDDKVFYARTLWQINPLLDLTAPDEKVVCDLTVTDCKSFWTTTLTISDLKQVKPIGIPDVLKFCGATQAALSGQEEYDSYKLSCRIFVSEKHAR